MTEDSKPRGYQMIVTAGQGNSSTSDFWLVTGPYWEPGGTDAALGAFSSMIEGEVDALAEARAILSEWPGAKLEIWYRGQTTPVIEGGTE